MDCNRLDPALRHTPEAALSSFAKTSEQTSGPLALQGLSPSRAHPTVISAALSVLGMNHCSVQLVAPLAQREVDSEGVSRACQIQGLHIDPSACFGETGLL